MNLDMIHHFVFEFNFELGQTVVEVQERKEEVKPWNPSSQMQMAPVVQYPRPLQSFGHASPMYTWSIAQLCFSSSSPFWIHLNWVALQISKSKHCIRIYSN